MKLERERVLTPEHKTVEGVLNHFLNWMEHWKVREIFADRKMTSAERRRRLKGFFNLTAEEPEEGESNRETRFECNGDDVEIVPTDRPESK